MIFNNNNNISLFANLSKAMTTMVKVDTKTLVEEKKKFVEDSIEEGGNLTEVKRGRILHRVSWFVSHGQYVH